MRRPRFSQSDRTGAVSEHFVRQVAREVIRLKRDVYPAGGDPRGKGLQYGRAPWCGPQFAIVTGAISQASGTVYGSGTVQVYYSVLPGDSLATGDPDSSTQPVVNWYVNSGTIAIGKHCVVVATAAGLALLTWEC